MSVDTWPEGVGQVVFDTVDSTMAEALRRAPGLTGPEWLLARSQTAARGRRGRPWVMSEGNFAASLTLLAIDPPDRLALRSFVAALALRDALIAVGAAPSSLTLKWPNDVLLNGGKLAGILLESPATGPHGGPLLIVGIGVNLAAAPDVAEVEPGALRPVSLASETGLIVAPEAFLTPLANAFSRHEARMQSEGFRPIRRDWEAEAAMNGKIVTARMGKEVIRGLFVDLDEDGRMVLHTDRGLRHIAAGDITF